jgi:myo-inositol-1(or 4)-monophosphatase
MAAMDPDPPDARPIDPDGAALADLAEQVAGDAAALLRDGLTRRQVEVETKSSGTDMVSEMDKAAERLIVDRLLGARPDDGVLGEEGADRQGSSGIRWVIDPLDGTTNYLYRHPGFSVSIAAEQDGRAVAGIVVDIPSGDVYRAVRGGGATCNGAPIAVSEETDLSRALVATGFGYRAVERRHQGEVLARIIGDIRDIRRMGSAALDLCSLASGRVDAYYELRLAPWDFAAGALIAQEAGAEVTDLDGAFPTTATVMGGPPALAGPLRDLLRAAGAEPLP